jgi:hypothetical protein
MIDQIFGFFIEEIAVSSVEGHGLDGHRAVQIDGELGELAFANELGDGIKDMLCTADRKSWNQDLLASAHSFLQDAQQLGECLTQWAMVPVSIGRLEDDQISTRRRVWRNGIAQNWDPSGPKVSRKHKDPLAVVVIDRKFRARRAKNVSRVKQTKTHSGRNFARLVVSELEEERLHGRHFVGAIKRLDKPLTLALEATVSPLCIRSLEMRCVFEDELGEVRRGSRGVNIGSEAALHKQWQPAAVVEMSVRENNGVKPAGNQPTQVPILTVRCVMSLVQAEIDKDPSGTGLDEVARPSDFSARRPTELDLHARLSPFHPCHQGTGSRPGLSRKREPAAGNGL